MFLKPDYDIKNIYDINLEELKSLGIKAILFDLDSTIMASKSGCYSEEMINWLNKVKENFFIAVVSNNRNAKYIEKVKNISDFPLLFNAGKPRTGLTKEFLRNYELEPEQCVLVGDRPLTDILCGKLLGCKTILVGSITADIESKLVRFVRGLERCFIRR